MDNGNLDHLIKKREHGYIWLEKELKRNIFENAAIILLLFVVTFFLLQNYGPNPLYWVISAVIITLLGIWLSYGRYRRIYRDFERISEYLEAFESGNYHYHSHGAFMKEGIHSQIIELLERIGSAFDTNKMRITEEKENTKVLVTDISHQLKTPLAALSLSFELMEDDAISKEEQQEFLQRGQKEVDKLKHLMSSLTNLSRMEADLIQIKPVLTGLKDTLLRSVSSIYMNAYNKEIEVELEEMEEILIPHDPKWTAEAFINVLDNAVKYAPAGTEIKILVRPQVSYVCIEIKDQGIGIPKEEYPYIFQRFYRGKDSLIAESEGSGVGLYLVRKILEEQGGSIRVIPSRRGGSIFQLMLPKEMYCVE